MAGAVSVGAVEEGDAAIERVANERDAVVIAARAVDAGQRHAAQTDRRHRDTGGAERPAWQLLRFIHVSSFQLSAATRTRRVNSQTTNDRQPITATTEATGQAEWPR